ncbi:MAG: sulfotransferase domain-containing protein [Nocardioides sp.]
MTTGQQYGGMAREAIKVAARQTGVLSSTFRPLPDFLLIGAKRGGTTSLYFDLLAHPAVLALYPPPVPRLKPEATKGVHYFDSQSWRSERWYRSHFPTRLTRRRVAGRTGMRPIAGEGSPYYLFHPAAAQRASALVPEAAIIVILRDPTMRAYSHWKERRRNGAEALSFEDAIAAEPDRLAGQRERLLADARFQSYAWEQQSYLAQSVYVDALRPWWDRFGIDRVHVTLSEDYYRAPADMLGAIQEFLGVPRVSPDRTQVRNAARGEDLDPGMRRRLAAHFADSNHALAALLGRELPWS